MKTKLITIKSYAKINLSLDVLGKREDGYHEVDMIMQMIDLHDDVTVKWIPEDCMTAEEKASKKKHIDIELKTNKRYLPVDERNIAYKAAQLMAERFGKEAGKIKIDIKKQIPVAAGLAGGSGNGAAVLHAVAYLWNLRLSLQELCELGGQLGADVPFCVIGQATAAANPKLNAGRPEWAKVDGESNSEKIIYPACCARASGVGTDLMPLPSLDTYLVLTKPPISVSTAEVYKGIDGEEIVERPNTQVLIEGIYENNREKITKNMVNVLELFTLKMYPIVMYTKNKAIEQTAPVKAIMSGSGPSVFAFYENKTNAQAAFEILKKENRETYLAHTIGAQKRLKSEVKRC